VKIIYSLCGTKRKTADLRHLGPLTPLGSFRPKADIQIKNYLKVVLVFLTGSERNRTRAEDGLTLWEPSLLQTVFYSGYMTTYIDVALKVSSLQNIDSFLYRHQLDSLEIHLSSIDS